MSYDYQFYTELLADDTSHVTLIGYLGDAAVASICIMRMNNSLYVKTITVAPLYRGKGLGSLIFYKGLEVADQSLNQQIYLHVWVKNIIACQFYTSLGFEIVRLVPSYYSRLSPAGAWELKSSVEQIKRRALNKIIPPPANGSGNNNGNIPNLSTNLSHYVPHDVWTRASRDPPYA